MARLRKPAAMSLMVRTFALLAALMLASVLAWLATYTWFEREPRARQLAQWVVTSVNTVRPALVNAQSDKRLDLLFDLALVENIRIYPAEPTDPIELLPDSALIESLTRQVREALGAKTRFASSVDDTPGFWVSFFIAENDEYWMRLPMEHVLPETQRAWLGWAALALLLSLAGAWLLVAYITRPMSRLAHAARAIARGEHVPVLNEAGPPETAQVAAAFNHLSQTLQNLEADRALSLAGVSHDLRTPLTRLQLEIEMAGLNDNTRESMSQEVREMDNIIGQFIDYARGVDDEPWSSIEPAAVLNEVMQSFIRRGAAFEYTPCALPTMQAKPMALHRALSNLINNALQYAGSSQPITVDTRAEGDLIEINIMDRGPGIAADKTETVKRAFVRGEAARSGAGGSGLGLAIVERMARYHGGQLQLLPRDGGGLIARLTLSRQPTP